MTAAAGDAGPKRSLRGPALRFAILIALIAGAFIAFRYTPLREKLSVDNLRGTLDQLRGYWWAPLAHVALLSIFGAKWGTVWNFTGVLTASCVGFGLARLLGR